MAFGLECRERGRKLEGKLGVKFCRELVKLGDAKKWRSFLGFLRRLTSKMPGNRSKSEKQDDGNHYRRDPYEVLGVLRNSTDQEIRSAYRRMALKYHPDKNANDPKAADLFKEATFSYKILSDPDKRRQFDAAGFEAVETDNQELELDLSSLGAVNTMFAALFCKLGVPIKTTVSANVLEEALNGMVTICPLSLGQPISKKVEKQCAHFYSVRITESDARGGLVCRVESPDKSKFKLLYFEQEDNSGLSLALQDESIKTGKVTSAGIFFLGFPVYRFNQTISSVAAAKDPDSAFFKRLDGLQPCEITEIKAGTHFFAVYGDNFFKSVSYTIEAVCATAFSKQKDDLRAVEAELLTKRVEISKFESEYREVLAQFTEMTSRYAQEKQEINELLKQRDEIQASYTTSPPMKRSRSRSRIRGSFKEAKEESHLKEKKSSRERAKNKKWFNIHLKVDKRKPC